MGILATTEFLIDGNWIGYIKAISGNLEELNYANPDLTYLGSGFIYKVNGVEFTSKELLHFFY